MRFSFASSIPQAFFSIRTFQRAGLAALAGLSLVSAPLHTVHAGPSDPTAANLIANALPGETTSTSCNSSGFIVVTFMGMSGGSSMVESSTTCTPGSGGSGGGTSSLTAQQQAELESELQGRRSAQVAQGLVDQLFDAIAQGGDEAQAAAQEAADFNAGEEEDTDLSEFTDEEKSVLAQELRAQIANLRRFISNTQREMPELRAKLAAAQDREKEAEIARQEAEAKLDRARYLRENSPTAKAVAAAEAELAAVNDKIENLRGLAYDHTYAGQESAINRLNAELIRRGFAEQKVADAKAENAFIEAEFEAAWRALQDAEGDHASLSIEADRIRANINTARSDMSSAQASIADLQTKIRALEQQNQLAGPSGDAFETLRARGLEFWSRGSVAFADDTQSGRNQEIEQQEITLGVQGRFSERLLLGLAVSYVEGENEDQTGTGISTDTDSFLFAPYLGYQLSEDLALDASGVYGFTDVSLTRATTATASYDSTTIGGAVGLSARHKLSEVISLTGRVGQSYFTTDVDGYTDTGGVTVASSDNEQAATSLSGRINVSTDPGWHWHGALNVRYDTIDPGNGVDRLYGALSTGLEYNPGPYAVAVQASRTVFRSNYEATGLSLQVRVPF
eukprot:s1_g989.t1